MTENHKTNVALDPSKDYFLQGLVSIVDQNNFTSIGVILHVGGLIISGKLVSEQSYFKGISIEMVSENLHEHLRDDFREAFQKLAHAAHELDNSEASSGPNKSLPEFIHLKDAKMYPDSKEPIPDNKGILWRGRISAVDGFSIGLLF